MGAENWQRLDFVLTNSLCRERFLSLLSQWLPTGKLRGSEWVSRNPTRNDRNPGSFMINVNSGLWSDFATGDRGGDPISLYAYLNNLSQGEAARELMKQIGGTL